MDNKKSQKAETSIRHYFIDEDGDGTLFSRNGKVLVGTPGCSRFFVLGLLEVSDPAALQHTFDGLRAELRNDPYFNNVPSMQADARKTALAFHAKDDLPEVRRDVFRLLRDTQGLRFFAVVADKLSVLEYVRQRNKREPAYRYHPNELYDYLTMPAFKERLHQSSSYHITFSKRGNSDRSAALHQALQKARDRFAKQRNIISDATLQVSVATPKEQASLQAVDYFVWALQRLYELGEDRYLAYLWPAFRMVHDIDDRRKAGYGVYYTQKKPLNAAALEWRQKIKKPGI